MKVLIIDDEQGILDLYQQQFAMQGIETVVANISHDGIELAKTQRPDVILLDIIMPHLNGLDVLTKLKNDPETKNTPVYLLTNLPEEASYDKARELGADGYFVKAHYEPRIIAHKLLSMSNNVLPGGK